MENSGRYIPAEIGIIKFNLKDGVHNNKLHLMIDPRKFFFNFDLKRNKN